MLPNLIYYLVKRTDGKLSIKNASKAERQYISLPELVNFKDLKKIKFYSSGNIHNIIKKLKK